MQRSRTNRIAYSTLAGIAVAAVLFERGIENGLWILGAAAYMSSLIMATSAALSSIAMKKFAFDRLETLLALFAVIFAIIVLLVARTWFPLGSLSAIAVISAVVIWSMTRLTNGWKTR